MFNMREFLVKNLVGGFKEGSFTEIQINLFAYNYLSRGQMLQEDFDYVMEQIELIKNPPKEGVEE